MKKIILDRDFKDSIDILCNKCGSYKNKCVCAQKNGIKKSKLITKQIRGDKIQYEIKKVKNKTISIFYPFSKDEVGVILKVLKKELSCGGSIRDANNYYQIILQGDVINRALELLGSLFDRY